MSAYTRLYEYLTDYEIRDLRKYFEPNEIRLLEMANFISLEEGLETDEYAKFIIVFSRDYRYTLEVDVSSSGTPGCCQSFDLSFTWRRYESVDHQPDPDITYYDEMNDSEFHWAAKN
jgi:hypothetical protein